MKSLLGVLFVLSLTACSSRTASCQLLYDCCHGNADCDPVVDQNDPGACQTQLVVSRGGGMCHDASGDAGSTSSLACMQSGDAAISVGICSEASGPSAPTACPAGTYAVSACPSVGEVGRCTLTIADGSVSVARFYAPTTTAAAMDLCTRIGGTFTPG